MGLYERLLEEKAFLELEERLYPPRLYARCEICGIPVPRNRVPVDLPDGRRVISYWSSAYCEDCRMERR